MFGNMCFKINTEKQVQSKAIRINSSFELITLINDCHYIGFLFSRCSPFFSESGTFLGRHFVKSFL